MKNCLKLLLVVLLTAALSVGGTLAFTVEAAQDTDVYALGDVQIQLKRTCGQDAEVCPGVAVSREVAVQNTGDHYAWVWVSCAVPTALVKEDCSILQLNMNGAHLDSSYTDPQVLATYGLDQPVDFSSTWHPVPGMQEDAFVRDGIGYTRFVWLYNGALAPGQTTGIALESFCLDPLVDIDDDGNLCRLVGSQATPISWNVRAQGNPRMIVEAFAVQKDAFQSVTHAYSTCCAQLGLEALQQNEP